MFPVGREKTWVVKQAQKVKEGNMKSEKEEISSPSGLQCNVFSVSTQNMWEWGAPSVPKLICFVFKLLLSKLGE